MSARLHKIDGEIEDDEDWLQRCIANHPEILPLRDLEGVDANLRLIARELDNIDLLFVDDRGLLTLVETKLYKNPEARREVIAQVLDYASKIRDYGVAELCRRISSTNGSQFVAAVKSLDEFVAVLHRQLSEVDSNSETSGKSILAHYVVSGNVSVTASLSAQEKRFLERLDMMLKEESFRLVIVMDKAPTDFFDILNYTASTTRRGTQLVGVELSIEPLDKEKFLVPHLIGTANRLSAEYYRVVSAERFRQEWDADRYLAQVPDAWKGQVSRIIDEVKNQDGRLYYDFGRGKTGALLLGVRIEKLGRKNTLLEIKPDGKVWIYGSLAGTGLSELQKEDLVSEIAKRPFLRQASTVIATGWKTKKYGSDYLVGIENFGTGDALIEGVMSLLGDYDRVANG